jgi:hypothetical protein
VSVQSEEHGAVATEQAEPETVEVVSSRERHRSMTEREGHRELRDGEGPRELPASK